MNQLFSRRRIFFLLLLSAADQRGGGFLLSPVTDPVIQIVPVLPPGDDPQRSDHVRGAAELFTNCKARATGIRNVIHPSLSPIVPSAVAEASVPELLWLSASSLSDCRVGRHNSLH